MTSSTVATSEMIDYYQRLNLEMSWSCDEIRAALRTAFMEAQSRVIAAIGEKEKEIELRISWIMAARKMLLDPEAKAKYDEALKRWKQTATPEQRAAAGAVPTLKELWALIDAGRYLDAVQAGKRLLENQPDNHAVWEAYARASYRNSDIEAAIHAAKKALSYAPENAEYFADAGQYLSTAERWDEAKAYLLKAIELAPDSISYKFTLCNIHMQHREWNDAEAILEGVLSKDPDHNTARSFMAVVISERAEERLEEVVALSKEGERKKARRLLQEIRDEFEKAQQLAEHDEDLRELINSESIAIRRALGVNAYMRIFGLLIDGVLLIPGYFLIALSNGGNVFLTVLGILLSWGVIGYSWVYLAYKNNGQDLTKRLLGMQVVSDEENSVPGAVRLAFRASLKPLTLGCITLAVGLMLFGAIVSAPNDSGAAFGYIIGLVIALPFIVLKLIWDLFFLSDKDLAPRAAFLAFLHDHLTSTTVACSTKDDAQNFGEYVWY